MKSKNAQVSVEFILILSALFFFMTIFLLAVQENMGDKVTQRENLMVKEIAITVQNEIDLAHKSIDGYTREFTLPRKAGNLDYEISVSEGYVDISAGDGKHSMAFPVEEVTGEVNITKNIIKRIDGVVYLNP